MFDYKRTPLLAVIIAGLLSAAILYFLKFFPGKGTLPFTTGQTIALYFLSLVPSIGIAMLFDPRPKRKREEYLKINFYDPETRKKMNLS